MKKNKISEQTTKIKKSKKVSEGQGIINAHFSFNNTILNLTRVNGEVLTQVSAGMIGYRNTKKGTPYAAQKCTTKIVDLASEYGINKAELRVKGIGAARDTVIKKLLETNSLTLTALVDNTPEKYGGGCRPRKVRRI